MLNTIHLQAQAIGQHVETEGADLRAEKQDTQVGCLRVMTFNIRHGKGMNGRINLNQIGSEIRRGGADVVALQEVDRFHLRSGFKDQIRKLGQMLDMQWCFAPSIKFGYSEYGNAFLSAFPILLKGVEYMRGYQERRSLLQMSIQAGKRKLRFFNTHLGVLPADRQRQFRIMRRTLNKAESPMLLMGDFNMGKEDPLMKQLNGFWRKIALDQPVGTVQSGREIDHIFLRLPEHEKGIHVNMALERLRAWVQPTTASDHHPVLADIPWSMLQ